MMLYEVSSVSVNTPFRPSVGTSHDVSSQTSGPRYRIDDRWKEGVSKWLQDNDRSQAWLTRELKRRGHRATPAAVSFILKTEAEARAATPPQSPVWQSRLALAIYEITGVPLPPNSNDPVSEVINEMLARAARENPARREQFVTMLRAQFELFFGVSPTVQTENDPSRHPASRESGQGSAAAKAKRPPKRR